MSHSNFTNRQPIPSRRGLLAAAGAAIALPALARGESPAPLAAATENSGVYRRKLGAFEVMLVNDGAFGFDPPFPLFGENVGIEKVKAALAREFIDYDNTSAHVHTLLIKTGREVVLVDTGCGSLFGPTTGKLLGRLQSVGVAPKDITAVVITHAHGDHVGALLGPEGAGVFPNAQYFVHKDEAAFWGAENPNLSKSGIPDEARGGFIQGAQTALKNISKKLTLLGDSLQVVDGIDAIPSPGHTPGHLTLLITSNNEQLYYIADAVHHYALTLAHPEMFMGFDTDREQGVKARKAVLDRAVSDRLLISGAHLPFPAFGHVRREGERFEWVPATWSW